MKRQSAILCGISTLIFAVTAVVHGKEAFAEELNKSQPRIGTEISIPSINMTSTTSVLSLLAPVPPPTGSSDRPDAIVTSSASTNSVGESSLNADTVGGSSEISKWSLRFDSIYFGASIADPGNLDTPTDVSVGNGFPVFIRNMPQLGYYINPNLLVGAVARIDLFPTHKVDYGWEDSFVHVLAPKLIDRGNFNVLGDLRVYLPTSSWQQNNGENFAIQTRVVPSWVVPNSRWTLAMPLYYQWTSHSSQVDQIDPYAKNAWDSEIYAGPNVSYQMTPTLALTALYEFDAVQLANTPFGSFISDTRSLNGYTDFEPGLSWDVTPNINISPFLNMYPGSNMSVDTTSFNVWFSFKLI